MIDCLHTYVSISISIVGMLLYGLVLGNEYYVFRMGAYL